MRRRITDVLLIAFFTVLFAVGLKSCIIDAYRIPSGSMAPALNEGDYLLVNKFIYGARTPEKFLFISIPHIQFPSLSDIHRGDVVVFHFPGEPNEALPVKNMFLVKRCVGLPGDTVEISNQHVVVNSFRMEFFSTVDREHPQTVVPKQGMSIAMNVKNFFQWKVFIQREGSSVELRDKKVYIDNEESTTYTVKRNYFFVLGDNINNSSDSREWGFVPEKNIIGKAMLIYWSRSAEGIQWSRIGTMIR
ncbi:MAG: signal peptidase I [Bacteroidota bacterium]